MGVRDVPEARGMSRREKLIRMALAEVGYKAKKVHWEPLGRDFEMCGRSGGWFVDDEPVGHSVAAVLRFIRECPSAWSRRCEECG